MAPSFRHLAFVSLGLHGILAQCPYASYASTFTANSAYCKQPGAILCIVDSQCKELPGSSFSKANVTKDNTATDQIIIKAHADNLAQLPLIWNTYVFVCVVIPLKVHRGCRQFFDTGLKSVGNLSSSNVSLLDFEGNTGISYANAVFPATMTRLSIARNALNVLPTTIPFGQLSEFYGWENNFTTLENVDFRNANEVKFTGIPTLTTLKNLSFSTKLTKLYFDKSDFTTFLVDTPTYQALQNVATFQVSSIDVSKSCVAPNKPMPLKTYTVCVSPGKRLTLNISISEFYNLKDTFIKPSNLATTVVPSPTPKDSNNMAVILGSVAGGSFVLGMVVWCIFQRRRKNNSGRKQQSHEQEFGYQTANTHDASVGGLTVQFNMDQLALVRLDEKALVKTNSVAQGAYGQVFVGEYKGEIVAIKCLLPGKNTKEDVQFLIEEIKLTSQLSCPYIVRTL
ncbi:hypothetical protein As57867_007701, partial [Aphanomyces stellatus]